MPAGPVPFTTLSTYVDVAFTASVAVATVVPAAGWFPNGQPSVAFTPLQSVVPVAVRPNHALVELARVFPGFTVLAANTAETETVTPITNMPASIRSSRSRDAGLLLRPARAETGRGAGGPRRARCRRR